jgi:hypothetical protein
MRLSLTRAVACVMLLAQLAFGAWRGQVVTIEHHACEHGAHHHADLHHHDHEDGHHGAHSHGDAPMHVHMPDHDARVDVTGASIAPLAPCAVPCAVPDCTGAIPHVLAAKGGCCPCGLSDDAPIPRSALEALNVIRLLV